MDDYKWILIGVGLVMALIAARKSKRARARRAVRKWHVRRYWEEKRPGEMYPGCKVCHLPYPVSFPDCPFCGHSRVRARLLRRDLDWTIETATGYGRSRADFHAALDRIAQDRIPPEEQLKIN